MFIGKETQCCQDVSSYQLSLIQCNPNENPSKLIYAYLQTDFKVYVENQKTQNSQHSIEEPSRKDKLNLKT